MSIADQEKMESDLYTAICLVRNLRAEAISMKLHPAAIRTALKFAVLVDTHAMQSEVPPAAFEEFEKFTTELADEYFREVVGLPPTESAIESSIRESEAAAGIGDPIEDVGPDEPEEEPKPTPKKRSKKK